MTSDTGGYIIPEMLPQWIIEKKRDGGTLAGTEIRFLIDNYNAGVIPDYQMAAFAMAVFFRGMDAEELSVLTDAMMKSGEVLDLSDVPGVKADKHSTGGIGDKVSLVLAPLAAACGLTVPMISGRGLGITGGTLDKLESIPGYRTNLSPDEFRSVLSSCGCSIIGQTERLAPADRKLYALRDVTGTVPSIPLISASIMSKKLAEGADVLVLDVKCGNGAFMKTPGEARELASTMVGIGKKAGRRMAALITGMDQPLGGTAGNSLEVQETIGALKGRGPADLMEATYALTGQMLVLGGLAGSMQEAEHLMRDRIKSGAALDRFVRMVRLHGGDAGIVEDGTILAAAPLAQEVVAGISGFVAEAHAGKIGQACLLLGAGRRKTTDAVDHSVGISGMRKIGERVERGQTLFVLHAAERTSLEKAKEVAVAAYRISREPVNPPPLISEVLT